MRRSVLHAVTVRPEVTCRADLAVRALPVVTQPSGWLRARHLDGLLDSTPLLLTQVTSPLVASPRRGRVSILDVAQAVEGKPDDDWYVLANRARDPKQCVGRAGPGRAHVSKLSARSVRCPWASSQAPANEFDVGRVEGIGSPAWRMAARCERSGRPEARANVTRSIHGGAAASWSGTNPSSRPVQTARVVREQEEPKCPTLPDLHPCAA